MNIQINIERDFITGDPIIRASVKIVNHMYAVISDSKESKPFYMTEKLFILKLIFKAKKELLIVIDDNIDYTRMFT